MKSLFHHKLNKLIRLAGLVFYFFVLIPSVSASNPSALKLNQAELDWLAANPIVKVAVSPDYAPISFINDDGQHIGMSADYLKLVQQQINAQVPQFQFQIVVPTPAERLTNVPLNKHVDMVLDFVQTPEREQYWYFSKTYIELPLHLIVHKNQQLKADLASYKNAKIAVVRHYAAVELIAKAYPSLQLVMVDTNQEGLKKVTFGDVDAFVSDLPVASYWANQAGLVQLKNAGKLPYSYKISFASSRQVPALKTILEKTLANISTAKQTKILDRWMLGTFVSKPLVSDFVGELLFASAIVLTIALGWLIKRVVNQRARQNTQEKALALLTQNQLRKSQKIEDIYQEIAQLAAETLQVERASIWLFNDAKTQLACQTLYLKSLQSFTSHEPLEFRHLPAYFNELTTNRVIAVADTSQDPVAVEFTHGYIQANKVTAFLDGTIRVSGETVGVICLEHTNGKRRWTLDEQSFVGSLADLCRISLETCRRRDAEQKVLKLNQHLEQEVVARALLLRETEKRYNYVLEHAPIPILILKKNGEIIEANHEAEAAYGAPSGAMVGKNFIQTVVAPESRKTAIVMAARTLNGDSFRNVELTLQNANGEKVQYICSIGMVTDAEDVEQGQMVAIAQNISQQKLLEYSLTKSREAAESADRIKSMFVASMSHELRTPLNSIIGFLGVVLQGMSGELNTKQKDQLGRAYHSSKHLLSLITDVIDISKIEAGYLQVQVEKFALADLLAEVQHAVQHLAEEKDIQLRIECEPQIKLETDRKRLYQVVLNVVSNGLKYSEQGIVKVVASAKGKQLTIIVKDTGIGISELDLANMFKPFVRLDSHLKIKTLGTGLGLYLTRKLLVQLLGGDVSVTSQLGHGSTFTINIPIKMPKAAIRHQTSVLEDSRP